MVELNAVSICTKVDVILCIVTLLVETNLKFVHSENQDVTKYI